VTGAPLRRRRHRNDLRWDRQSAGPPSVRRQADGLGWINCPKSSAFCVFARGGTEEGMSNGKPSSKGRNLRKPIETDLGFSWGRTNVILLGLGLAALVFGYMALARGSLTLAPILLVLGYCGLIPASLLIRERGTASGE